MQLHLIISIEFNCFVCNKWWSIYYFFYNCYWSSCWNSTCKFYQSSVEQEKRKEKKHDKILVLAKSKLNSIETLVSQVLVVIEIGDEEFIAILNEKNKYEKMKENLRNINEKLEEKK